MKIATQLSFLIGLFLCSCVYGQQFQGIATYKSQRKMDIELDSTMNDGMKDQIMAMLKKQSEKEFNLVFTDDESEYKEEVPLDNNSVISGGGMEIVVQGSGGNDVLYKNLNQNRYANQTEIFGKQFLIKDVLENIEWELGKETKNIGEYACFKATYSTTRTVMNMETSSEDNNEEGVVRKEEPVVVTAWYTPQIPVKNGPSNYQGLPGLILEINDGSETILCSKIVLNPEKGISIKEPEKGKVVTDVEYRTILEEKMKEMNEEFNGDGRRQGDRHSMQIRIGG